MVANLCDVMGSFHRRSHYDSLATMTILPATRFRISELKLIAYISKLRARGGAVLCVAHGCLGEGRYDWLLAIKLVID